MGLGLNSLNQHPGLYDHGPQRVVSRVPFLSLLVANLRNYTVLHPLLQKLAVIGRYLLSDAQEIQRIVYPYDSTTGKKCLQFRPWQLRRFQVQLFGQSTLFVVGISSSLHALMITFRIRKPICWAVNH